MSHLADGADSHPDLGKDSLTAVDRQEASLRLRLGVAMYAARDGIGEVQHLLSSTTFHPRLPGLTKMVSRLGKEGCWRKALEIYQSLPQTGVRPDTAITNAAISACDKGGQWRAALGIYESMDGQGLRQDAITCSSLISALAKGKQWILALQNRNNSRWYCTHQNAGRPLMMLNTCNDDHVGALLQNLLPFKIKLLLAGQVFDDMQARGVLADVVTCCSLINALERGGQWQLAEQLFVQMCAASWQAHGVNSPLYRIMEIAAAPCPPQDADPTPTEHSPALSRAQSSQTWEQSDSDLSLVMSPQQNQAPNPGMYTSLMLTPLAPTPAPLLAPPVTPVGPSLDSKLSSANSFPRYTPGSASNQSQQGNPFGSLSEQLSVGSLDSGSSFQTHGNDPNQHSLFSRGPAEAPGASANNTVMQTTPPSESQNQVTQPAGSNSGSSRSVTTDMTSPVMHTPPHRSPSEVSRPAGRSSSNCTTNYARMASSPGTPNAMHGSGNSSPAGALLLSSCSTASGQAGGASSELLRSFSNMRVGSTSQSVQRALFPPETLTLQNSPSHIMGSPPQALSHETSLSFSQDISRPMAGLTRPNSFSYGDSQHQALHRHSSFPQDSTRLQGLIHQSSLNSIGSETVLGSQGSFTRGSSESGVLRHQGSFGSGNSPEEGSDATVRRIQEAAADRQELLSLTPTTTPVGCSKGQAPVLRHMNVSQIAPNRVCCNALLAAYARAKPTCWQKALAFLEVMQSSEGHIRPDTVTYNTVLKACCNAGQLARAMQASPCTPHVFMSMMQSGVELTITTFGTLLIAGAEAHDYSLVWEYLEHAGLEANPACINAYVQALVYQGEWSEAQKHFRNLLGRGSRVRAPIVTINTIMAAYMKQGMFDQVQQVFDDMYTAGLQPNIMTYITLLSSYAELGKWQNALHVLNHMCQPQVAIVPNTLAFNHVLSALLKAAAQPCMPDLRAGLAESGVGLFNQMLNRRRTPPDCNTYDTLISLMLEVGAPGQALHLHQLKMQQGLAMNTGGLSRIVTSCSQLGLCEEAFAGWTMTQAAGAAPDPACLTALLAALHAAKQWQHAVHVFQASRQAQVQPDATAHNLVLATLVDAEQLQGSLSLLADMQAEGLQAEAASCDRLVMLLLMAGELQVACQVSLGLLAHGQSCGAEPTSCIVHLLKDDGQVWEALHIIKLSLQVAPSLRLDTKEHINLAEKALISCGMAPAVWLLVQLHQAHAITFYTLPGHTATASMPHLSAKGSSAEPTSAGTVSTTLPQVRASAPCDERVHLGKGEAAEGELEETQGEGTGGQGPYSTITLIGVSVDVAIIVVLSWAAQLAQLASTSVMMQNDDITFELGGSHISEDPTAVRSALQKLLNLPAPHLGSGSTGLSAEGSPGSFQEKIVLVIPTQHLFAWIDKHKEVLQKLLSEGEAFAASHRSGLVP
ncbi:hypothetical protein ABBQ38_009900 [Trebouxia sp. C0009 RCD-2024]